MTDDPTADQIKELEARREQAIAQARRDALNAAPALINGATQGLGIAAALAAAVAFIGALL